MRMEDILGVRVQIHPVALFSVVDSYERRQESDKRVIGSLLGVKTQPGLVEVRSGYAVPHNETADEVAVDMDFDKEMLKLHQRVNHNEVIVGWYSTFQTSTPTKVAPSPENKMHSVYIHDYYSRSDSSAIFLTVDTSMRNARLEIKAYTRSKVGLPGKTEGIIFTPIPCEVVYFAPEKVGIRMLNDTVVPEKSPTISVVSNFHQIEKAIETIDQLLTKVVQYSQDAKAGRISPDGVVGRKLMETVSRVPTFDGAKYESMLNAAMQDLLMVVYLANLTKTQVVLGERLCKLPS